MTKPANIILTSEDDASVFFGEVFRRPNESLIRPMVGVVVFYAEDGDEHPGFIVSVMAYGPHTGAAKLPEGIAERRSDIVDSREGKRLLGEWIKEVRAAVDTEWREVTP